MNPSTQSTTRTELSESEVNPGNQSTRRKMSESGEDIGNQATRRKRPKFEVNPCKQATRTEMSESEVNPGNQSTRTELLETTLNLSNQSTGTELSESEVNLGNQSTRTCTELLETTVNPGNQSTGTELSESEVNPGNQSTRTELLETTLNPGNQPTRTEVTASTLNPDNQSARIEVSESTLNPDNQASGTEDIQRTSTEQTEPTAGNQVAGIDSRSRGLTMQNISNQESLTVQACSLVTAEEVGILNTGRQTFIFNQGDEESVLEAVGEAENRISQSIDELKQTVIDQSKVIESQSKEIKSQSKEIKSQREVIKELTERDDNPVRRSMIETTKARIDWGTGDCFVPTKVFDDAKSKLLKQKIVIIKGNSGDGKTRTALELLSWMWKGGNLVDDKGNQIFNKRPIQVYSFNDLGKTVDPNLNLCIFIDDVSTDLFNEIERNQESVMSLISGQMNGKSNCLVITLRKDVFKSISSNVVFVEKHVVDTTSKKYHIKEEKQQILDVYLPKEVKFSKTERSEIVMCAPDIGFPQCCRWYRDVPELQKQGVKFFHKPIYFVKNALSKLQYGRCTALLYLFLCGGRVLKKDLDPSNDKVDKTLLEEVFDVDLVEVKSIGLLSHKKKVQFIHKSLDCLSGSLVTKQKLESWWWDDDDDDDLHYRFSHDSVKDTVALLYGEVTPIGFIKNCHCNSLCYITTSKNTPNKVFIDPENYKHMYSRLLEELKSKHSENYTCIASLDVWNDSQFMSGFFSWLDGEGIDKDFHLKWTTEDVDRHGPYHFYTDRGDRYYSESDDSHSSDRGDRYRGHKYFPSFLVYVAEINNLCLLKQLLERTPNDHPQLQCGLFGAVRDGHIDMFNMIIERVINPTVRAYRSQSSHWVKNINVLHEACLFERVEMVTKLATKYPSLVQDTCHIYKLPTLHVVVRTGNCSLYDTVETIILGDISREDRVKRLSEMVDVRGRTVLCFSCSECDRSNTMVLHLLDKYPELVSIRDKFGCHCLHWIALFSNKDLFIQVNSCLQKYYKGKGINYDITTIVDNIGRTVLDWANRGGGDDDMCSYLSQFWS